MNGRRKRSGGPIRDDLPRIELPPGVERIAAEIRAEMAAEGDPDLPVPDIADMDDDADEGAEAAPDPDPSFEISLGNGATLIIEDLD